MSNLSTTHMLKEARNTFVTTILLWSLIAPPAIAQSLFATIGDYGDGSAAEGSVAGLVSSWTPDFIITLGDNRYASTDFDETVGQFYCNFLTDAGNGSFCSGGNSPSTAFFPSLGNHDYTDGAGLNEYLDYFTLPGSGVATSGTSGSERYYDFIKGPVHFFVIDSEGALNSPSDKTTQMTWLQAQLAASSTPWQVVYFHHAPYSSATLHGSNPAMQWPFASWGADAVISGHDHTYERIFADGIVYFVNGLGGDSVRNFSTPVSGSQVRYGGDYGAMRVNASDTAITFEFINLSGSIIDTYTIGTIPPNPNVVPTAAFTYSCTDLDCSFTDTSTDDDGSVTSWEWDFDDGNTANTQNPGHSYATAGTYTVSLTATDDDNATHSTSQSVTVIGTGGSGIVNVRVTQSTDDVEEDLAGAMYITSSDLELGNDPGLNGDQTVGLRFQNVNIPQGATITAAFLEFETDETGSSLNTVTIAAEATNNASAFTSTNFNLTGRTTTLASVGWNIPAWGTINQKHQSPDLSTVVQEVVDRGGWSTNSNLAFIITGSGTRTAEAYDGEPAAAPLLHVEYTTDGGVNTAPTAAFTYSCTDLDCDFTDASSDSDGSITAWTWDLGDGNSAATQHPNHSYAAAGTYTVSLTATDNDGATHSSSQSVMVVTTSDKATPTTSNTDVASQADDSGGGGGGCTIRSNASVDSTWLLMIIGFGLGYMRQRLVKH